VRAGDPLQLPEPEPGWHRSTTNLPTWTRSMGTEPTDIRYAGYLPEADSDPDDDYVRGFREGLHVGRLGRRGLVFLLGFIFGLAVGGAVIALVKGT
jgi:hypothetical protein